MRARPPFVHALLALMLSSPAHAAPLPAPRPLPGPPPGSPSEARGLSVSALRARAPVRGCATDLDAMPGEAATLVARESLEPLPTTHTRDRDGLSVLEDDGTFFYTNSGGQPHVDIASVARAYARTHADTPDQIAIYLASGLDHWLGSPGALAASWLVRNDIQGIGLGLYDLTAVLGLWPRLSAIMTMNGLHRYPEDPDAPIGGPGDTFSTMDVLAHEFGHRWLAYTFLDSAGTESAALLGRDFQHWGFFFDSDSSYMEGCDWTAVTADSFRTTGVSSTFGLLDQYLMGVRSREEMDSLLVLNDPSDLSPPGIYIPTSIPQLGVSCDARPTRWTVDDIERLNGPRVPASGAGGDTVRVAFILVTSRGSAASEADLAKLGVIRDRFASTIGSSTLGRMAVESRPDPLAGPIVIAHDPLRDTEDGSSPRAVRAAIRIGAGARPHQVDASSVMLHWRADGLGPEQSLPMASVAPDSFEALLPPAPGAARMEYRITAASDSAARPGWPQPSGASPDYSYAIGPDLTPPAIRHTPVAAQGRTRLPQALLARATDGTGVDSVWAEVRVNGGPTLTTPGTRAGRDSFVVSLGGGQAEGSRLAYRILARDRAQAPQVGYSNAAWDTLLVIDDWNEEFENPSPWFTYNVLYSWRTLWHVARRDSADLSARDEFAWHSGSEDGTPYPPHVDGALYSPMVPELPPGSRLRFLHRYDLEARDATRAWDGARVEISVSNGPWQVVMPLGGYSHVQSGGGQPFASGSPCWSGTSPWRETEADLSPFAPGPVRLRFRMTADNFVGGEGWWVDRVRIEFPGGATLPVPPQTDVALALGPAWPHPASSVIHQAVRLPDGARIRWTLHDLQGRHVATLGDRALPAGTHTLQAALPSRLASGVYFARLEVAGEDRGVSRVAVLR